MFANLMLRFPRIILLALTVCLAGPAASLEPMNGDLAALRYYFEQGDEASVGAEMQRLMLLFPEWTPPENVGDIFTTRGPERIDNIYRLIEQSDYAGARALIADANATFPEWAAPTEMMELLSLGESQGDFDAAVSANDATTVINIVRGVPSLLSCERINNLWELAEAHLSLGDTTAALGTYRAVVQTCTTVATLIATLEKSAAIAPSDTLAEFSDIAQAQAPGASAEIRVVEDRLRIGRQEPPRWDSGENVIDIDPMGATQGAVPVPGTAGGPAPSTQPVPRPEAPTATAAPAPAPAPAPAQVASPVQNTGRGGLSAIQAAARSGAWAQCLALSAGSTRVDIVAQRGWCAYNADRSLEAIAAFKDVAQRGNSPNMRRDATFGLLLSMLSQNMTEQAAQVAATAPLTRDQRVEVEGQILDQRGVRAYNSGEFARAVAFFAAHEALTGTTRRDLSLLRGYALLNMGDRIGARDIFERLHRQLSTAETRRALRAVN